MASGRAFNDAGTTKLTTLVSGLELNGLDTGVPESVATPWELILTRIDYTTVSANYSIVDGDVFLYIDTAGITITLPTAQHVEKRDIFIFDASYNAEASNIVVETGGSKTISNESTIEIDIDGALMRLWADATNWHIIQL